MADLLDVRRLTTHFFTRDGEVKALEGVSYSVAAGETIAVVGESGCGKTVSALSILRLIPEPPGKVLSGEVLFEGKDLLKLSTNQMCRVRGAGIAMVFQEPKASLNPLLTIGRQVSEAIEAHQGMTRRQAEREAVRLLALVGIPRPDCEAKSYPHHFSGGMRQRVMVAMAISCKPKLIIADEPTTALDVTIQAQLLELLRSITRDPGTALITITHNLGVAARYAQRVYLMYAGRIVEHGPAIDVYRDPRHPYTLALLASVPRLDQPRKDRLELIQGQPPDPLSLIEGCAFQPRCPFHSPACSRQAPDLIEVSSGHYSACRLGGGSHDEWQ